MRNDMRQISGGAACGLLAPAFAWAVILCSSAAAAQPKVSLGPWYVAGPFKDTPIGLHLKSFDHVFGPEKQAIEAAGKLIDLSRTWKAEHFIGEQKTLRRWEKHPEWVDGYHHYLPTGPPPMKNETCYLYRTITASEAATVEMRIYALDNIRAWLDGKLVGQAGNPNRAGASRFAASLVQKISLKAGDNRLLVKITSMHGMHGFAFAMPPLTPSNSFRPGQGIRSVNRFHPGDEPYASAQRPQPAAGKTKHEDYNHALARLRGFRFSVTPIPMYDPPRLKMNEDLRKTIPQTPAGKAYLERLAELRKKVAKALAAERTSKPDKAAAVIKAADDIELFWTREIRALPPIAFIQCPSFSVNAIAPYTARGAAPASICVFDPARPDRSPRVVWQEAGATIFDMNLSWDARRLLFSARRRGVEGGWHIYEIGTDGSGFRQITRGSHENISPVELPNGQIMFVSTRAGARVICQKQASGLLYVCNRDGGSVRKVSGNTLSDHTPQVMNDGRVMFTRWDYGIDKNVFCRQNLWTMNPDGTGLQVFGSNTKEDPDGFWQARTIPGRPEVVCVFGPHHSYHAGMIGLVWNRPDGRAKDRRGEGFRWVTSELPTISDMTLPWGYQDPFPLNEHQFLVSYGGDGGQKNRLYLLDDRGNRKCIYEAKGKLGCWSPLPLRPRKTPPVITPRSNNPQFAWREPELANRDPHDELTGTFLLQDVYKGLRPHVKRGEIKALQIIEQVPRSREVQAAAVWGHWAIISRGTTYVRRLIGTVPVEGDGSAHFAAPAIRDISFNALDADGRVIRRMGSTMYVMPGEKRSCIGCHERRAMSPPAGKAPVAAAKRVPSIPKYPQWTDKGILDFTKVVQPVLDKYCIKCHSGPTPKGAMDLSGDKTHYFSMAYDMLLDRGQVHYIPVAGTDHEHGTAKARGSYVSKIRTRIETKHSGKVLPAEARRRIYAWIDANVPYYGTYVMTNPRTMGGRDRWYVQNKGGWLMKDFMPVFNRKCLNCHKRYVKPQTYNYNPGGKGTIMVTSKIWDDMALSQFQHGHGRISMIGQIGPSHRINLTHPQWSRMLTAPLAKSAGGMQLCKSKDGGAVFKDKSDGDYKAMLAALQKGHKALIADPRVDMPAEKKKE